MPHVFMSYSRRDIASVRTLVGVMQKAGCRVWIDQRAIAAGDQWRLEIVEAIRKASLFILVLSPNAARSNNVRKELDLAEGARARLLPVAISPTDIPAHMQYQLAGLQILPLWRDPDQGTAKLLSILRKSGLARNGNSAPVRQAAARMVREAEIDLSHLGGGDLVAGWLGRPRG